MIIYVSIGIGVGVGIGLELVLALALVLLLVFVVSLVPFLCCTCIAFWRPQKGSRGALRKFCQSPEDLEGLRDTVGCCRMYYDTLD